MTTKARKLTLMAMLTAIALTIFMIEAQIPPVVPLPGVKLGLANIVTVFAVFAMGPKEAAAILFVRIFLGAVFAGNFSTILYSGAGGACAIAVTIGLRKILTKQQLWVAGALSAIGHSVGQMAVAIAITATTNPVAQLAMDSLEKLKNSEFHSTVILSEVDMNTLKKNIDILLFIELKASFAPRTLLLHAFSRAFPAFLISHCPP